MDSQVHYMNPDYITSLLSVLNEQRSSGQLCDVTIIVGDRKFRAHKNVLAASSVYFQAFFNRGDTHRQSVVQLDFCDPEVFEKVLNYIYSSSLFVNLDCLAAVQVLGCTLGIPFLVDMKEKQPQFPYMTYRKNMLSEDNKYDIPSRNVAVAQNHNDHTENGVSHLEAIHLVRKPLSEVEIPAELMGKQSVPAVGELYQVSECEQQKETVKNTALTLDNSDKGFESSHTKLSPSALRKHGKMLPTEQPLTFPVSFIDLKIQHGPLHSDTASLKNPLPHPSIDSSVFTTVLLLDGQIREPSAKAPDIESSNQQINVCEAIPTMVLPSKDFRMYSEPNVQKMDIPVKTDPSSQLGDLSEIIQVTVGDDMPVDFRNFPVSLSVPNVILMNEEDKKINVGSELSPLIKSEDINEKSISSEGHRPNSTTYNLTNDTPSELKQNRIFKCQNCLKVFQTSTGLNWHINMFHNPEKLYVCEIYHKRFKSNLKVWNHCQTQHGGLKKQAPAPSSFTGLDGRLHRKSAGLVQGIKLKKSLWGSKSESLQSQINHKYYLRSRSKTKGCPQCGEKFRFLSQFKRHLKLPHCEKSEFLTDAKSGLSQKDGREQKDKSPEIYCCTLCSKKFSSEYEQKEHERRCQDAAVCPHCELFFSASSIEEHETHCEYQNLTCKECMQTFKSSFSMRQHQVEVHSQKHVTRKEPSKKTIDGGCQRLPKNCRVVESSLWPCEKCGKHFNAYKQLEHHLEHQCCIKPFICHICQKSFKTNFRLWSHVQSHTSSPASACTERSQDVSSCFPSENTESLSVTVDKKAYENTSGGFLHNTSLSDMQTSPQLSGQLPNHAPAGSEDMSKKKYFCKQCHRTFKTAFSLWSHEHSAMSKKQHNCKQCHRTFKTAFRHSDHMQGHSSS